MRKGEKATPIVFYLSRIVSDKSVLAHSCPNDTESKGSAFLKPLEVTNEKADLAAGDEATKIIRMVKGYWGFNADQVDNYTLPELPTDNLVERVEHAEMFFANIGVPIQHGGARAFYRPSDDFIQMPDKVLFRHTKTSTATEGLPRGFGHEAGALRFEMLTRSPHTRGLTAALRRDRLGGCTTRAEATASGASLGSAPIRPSHSKRLARKRSGSNRPLKMRKPARTPPRNAQPAGWPSHSRTLPKSG